MTTWTAALLGLCVGILLGAPMGTAIANAAWRKTARHRPGFTLHQLQEAPLRAGDSRDQVT